MVTACYVCRKATKKIKITWFVYVNGKGLVSCGMWRREGGEGGYWRFDRFYRFLFQGIAIRVESEVLGREDDVDKIVRNAGNHFL